MSDDAPRTGIHYLVITDPGKESAIMSNDPAYVSVLMKMWDYQDVTRSEYEAVCDVIRQREMAEGRD